jgi:hypothetical protein
MVEIGLPQDETNTDRNNFCNIGRLAEVRFERIGFGLLDSLGKQAKRLAGYLRLGAAADQLASK